MCRLILNPFLRQAILEAWQDGTTVQGPVADLPENLDLASPCLVLRQGHRVAILWGGMALGWDLDPGCLRPEWPAPACGDLGVQTVLRPRMPVLDWYSGSGQAQHAPRIAALPIRGAGMVRIPPSVPAAAALALWIDAATPQGGAALDDWLAGWASLPPGAPPPNPAGPAAATVLACLMPRQPVDDPRGILTAAGLSAIAGANHWATATRPAAPPPAPLPASPSIAPATPPTLPGLDIVVALHNQRDRVLECIAGLLPPGRNDIRVLVVDDGSTDGGADLLDRQYSNDPRLRILSKPNGGCASARNYGRLTSDRSHLAFVDADDATDPGFHAALLDLAITTNADLTLGGFDLWDADARTPYPAEQALLGDQAPEKIGGVRAWPLDPARLLPSQPAIWRAVYRRDLLDRHELWFPESIRAFDDFEFHLRSLLHARTLWYRPDLRYLYRQHPGQDVRQRDQRHFGNLAMATAVLRDLARTPTDRTGAVIAALTRVIGWSASQVPRDLTGDYLRAAADLWTMIEAGFGPGYLPDPQPGGLAHPDFAAYLARARDRADALPPGPWWAQAEPALVHPGTVGMSRVLTG